jgi:hypothetical protein
LSWIGRKRLIPGLDIGDTSNREHDADLMAFEIVYNISGHADGDTLRGLSIVGFIEQLERLNKTQNNKINRGNTISSINEPVIFAIKLCYTTYTSPETSIIAALPGAIDGDGRGCGGSIFVRGDVHEETHERYKDTRPAENNFRF